MLSMMILGNLMARSMTAITVVRRELNSWTALLRHIAKEWMSWWMRESLSKSNLIKGG
jgi:hypothetical protein